MSVFFRKLLKRLNGKLTVSNENYLGMFVCPTHFIFMYCIIFFWCVNKLFIVLFNRLDENHMFCIIL